MKKTHKKILGFTGLGLVAAVTTVAAALPGPLASALSVSDNVTVVVTSATEPTLEVSSTQGSEITTPDYSFTVVYSKLYQMTAIITKSGAGSGTTFWNENVGGATGSKNFALNMNDYGGYGSYTITVTGKDQNNVPVEQALAVTYKDTTPAPTPPTPDPDPEEEEDTNEEGEATIPTDVPGEKVEKVVVNIYDEAGNLVYSTEVNDPSEASKIDLSSLGNGNYRMEILSLDKDGKVIATTTSTAVVNKKEDTVTIEDKGDDTKKVVIVVTDEDGNVRKTIEIDNPNPGDKVDIDLSDLPDGNYTITTKYLDGDGNEIDSKSTDIDTKPTVDVNIKDIEGAKNAIIRIVNEEGVEVKTVEINNPSAGIVTVDLSGIGEGKYSVIVDYYDENGNKIDSDTSNSSIVKTDDSGKANPNIKPTIDTVTTIEAYVYDKEGNIVRTIVADRITGTVYVYDKDGNLLFTIPNGYRSDRGLTVPMEGLEAGDYTTVIAYKDANGKIVGDTKTVKINYENGKAIVVPDTGSFFQGLNMTREDYLITGAVVFSVIGVVAFGVVAKNKRSMKSRK